MEEPKKQISPVIIIAIVGVILFFLVLVIGGLLTAGFFIFGYNATKKTINTSEKKIAESTKVQVPVKVIYNNEAYVISDIPTNVEVTISGDKKDIFLYKTLNDLEVTIDLTGYKPRDDAYKIPLSIDLHNDKVDYKINPKTIDVTIYEKKLQIKSITSEIINEDKLNSNLKVDTITLEYNEAIVKGREEDLNKIDTIKTLIDLSNTMFKETGTYQINNIELSLYNDNGKFVDNVEIVPKYTSATIVITQK